MRTAPAKFQAVVATVGELDKRASDSRKRLGSRGEDLAAAHLAKQGYTILARNWRTRRGELDIIARDGDWLVFVEVRTRRIEPGASIPALGHPEDSVTPRKQLQLVAMADAYLFEMPWAGRWRIDVIALEIGPDDSVVRLNHLRDAVGRAW